MGFNKLPIKSIPLIITALKAGKHADDICLEFKIDLDFLSRIIETYYFLTEKEMENKLFNPNHEGDLRKLTFTFAYKRRLIIK